MPAEEQQLAGVERDDGRDGGRHGLPALVDVDRGGEVARNGKVDGLVRLLATSPHHQAPGLAQGASQHEQQAPRQDRVAGWSVLGSHGLY